VQGQGWINGSGGARFFQTRALAKAAIERCKVPVSGWDRCKPGKGAQSGEELEDPSGVLRAADRVGPDSFLGSAVAPPEAQTAVQRKLAESTATCAKEAALKRKALWPGLLISEHRPTKKQRRQITASRNVHDTW